MKLLDLMVLITRYLQYIYYQLCLILEEHSVESYWEMLSEYDSGYSKAKILWEEVQPLYRKLYDFVKVRLVNYYKINGNDSSIPIYLLGKLTFIIKIF